MVPHKGIYAKYLGLLPRDSIFIQVHATFLEHAHPAKQSIHRDLSQDKHHTVSVYHIVEDSETLPS